VILTTVELQAYSSRPERLHQVARNDGRSKQRLLILFPLREEE